MDTAKETSPALGMIPYELWHARIGHKNRRDSMSLAKALNLKVKGAAEFCEPCVTAKQHRAKVTKGPRKTAATKPGERVHFDLAGPWASSTPDARFVMVFVDERTRETRCHWMQSKSTAAQVFKSYCDVQGNSSRHKEFKVTGVYSDNDAVFDQSMRKTCAERNIHIERCPVGVPEKNGLVERKIGVLTETAKALLLSAGLDDKFTKYAFNHATMLSNLTPTAALEGLCVSRTPYEMATGKLPPRDL